MRKGELPWSRCNYMLVVVAILTHVGMMPRGQRVGSERSKVGWFRLCLLISGRFVRNAGENVARRRKRKRR